MRTFRVVHTDETITTLAALIWRVSNELPSKIAIPDAIITATGLIQGYLIGK